MRKFDPVGWKPNQQFETEMANVSKEIFENRAVLVYFDRIEWRYYLPARDELDRTYKLPVLKQLPDGVVYGK